MERVEFALLQSSEYGEEVKGKKKEDWRKTIDTFGSIHSLGSFSSSLAAGPFTIFDFSTATTRSPDDIPTKAAAILRTSMEFA